MVASTHYIFLEKLACGGKTSRTIETYVKQKEN